MNLVDVIQYTHKTKKIKITNENKQSLFSYVIIKITLPTRDDETIRFSLEPNDSFIAHQHDKFKKEINIFANNSFDNNLENWHTDANNSWGISNDGLDGKAAIYPKKALRATLYQNVNLDNVKTISFYVKSGINTEISLLLDNQELTEKNQIKALDTNEWTQLTYDVVEYNGVHQIKFFSIPKYDSLLLDNFQCELINDSEDFIISTDDYYCRIPNKLNDVSYIYAHFLPSDLYTYENEITDFVSFYDFKNIFKDAKILKNRYDNNIDSYGRLIVQSTDSQSIDGHHNPNYKQYTDIDNYKNKTKQGHFPLSSKYRSNQDWEVPNLSDPYPKWSNNTDAPKWEAKIPFDNNIEGPINVFINYEYLPTSHEYHQHYFGFEGQRTEYKTINVFEGTNINVIDKKFGSKNNYRLINYDNPYDDKHSFYIPHTKIISINLEDFTPSRNSKRELTCKWEKNFCYDYYIYTPLKTTNSDEKKCTKNITLESGKYYSLRYYIYIPSYIDIEDDKGYISVVVDGIEYKIDSIFIRKDKELRNQWIYHEIPFLAGTENIIKIVGPQNFTDNNNIFFINLKLQEMVEYSPTIQYSKTGVRLIEQNQSTFKSIAEYNTNAINLISNNSIVEKNNTNTLYIYAKNKNNVPIPYETINFYMIDDLDIQVNITPDDILYGNNNQIIFTLNNNITEKNQINTFYTYIKNKDNVIISNQTINLYIIDNTLDLKNENTFYDEIDEDINLPIPYSNIIISTKDEKYVYYDPKTTNLYCVHPIYENNETHIMRYDVNTTNLYGKINDEDISFEYRDPKLFGSFSQKLVGVYGPDNIFIFYFTDTNGYNVEDGTVEIGIFMTPDRSADIGDSAIKVTQSPAKVTGTMQFNVDLTNLQKNTTDPNNKYYVRLEYTNPCQMFNKIVFKPLYVYEEKVTIECLQINNNPNNKNGQSIIDYGYYIDDIEQIPIKITACIKDQYGALKEEGYCELSINDKLHQATINDNGYVDFYLNLEDLEQGHQTIKIEYYRKYYKSLGFIYFDLELKDNINTKPIVPINVKMLKNGQTYNINNNHYIVDVDDVVLSTITTNEHSKFRVEVYCDEELIEKRNFYNKTTNTIDFINTKYNDWTPHKFTIKTGNMQDVNGNDIEDLYNEHTYSFVIAYPISLSSNTYFFDKTYPAICTIRLFNSDRLKNINKTIKLYKI